MLTHRISRHDLPALIFRSQDTETVRSFPDKLPIGVDRDGEYTFVYLMTRPGRLTFGPSWNGTSNCYDPFERWTIRLLVPRHYAWAGDYQAAFRNQLAMPLRPINLDDLRWYFHARLSHRKGPEDRFNQAARAFSATRLGRSIEPGSSAATRSLDATLSTVLADKIQRQAGQLECHALTHQYLHLSTLVGTA